MPARTGQSSKHVMWRLLIATALGAGVGVVDGCGNHDSPTPASQLATGASAPANARSVGAMATCPIGSPGCGDTPPPQPPPDSHAPAHARSVATPCGAVAANPDDPMLTPLSADDIQLYLRVMHAAAERVRHPTAADRAALQHQRQWDTSTRASVPKLEAAAEATQANNMAAMQKIMAAVNKGDYTSAQAAAATANAHQTVPPPTIAEPPADIQLAWSLDGHADDIIVAAQHIDADRYARIVDVIEYIVVPPQDDYIADGGGTIGTPCIPTAQSRAIDAAEARQRTLLQPYRDQIRALEAVVRTTPKGQ